MEVRELDFTELQRLKNADWWNVRNSFTKLSRDIRSGFIHIYAVTEGKCYLATVKVSGKVTVLGREIAKAAAQVYGITADTSLENSNENIRFLIDGVLGELKKMGYKQVVVVHAETNECTRGICKHFNITDEIGSVMMEGGKGDIDKYIIVRGDISGRAS